MEVIVKNGDTKKIDLVNSNFNESKTWLQSSGYTSEWESWNNLYRSIPPKKPYTWMSNKFIPLVNSKVETAYANIQSLLFSANPPFQVRPRETGDQEQAKLIQKLLQYQFEEAGVPYEFMNFIRSTCIYGTGIGKIIWDKKFDNRTILQENYEPIINIMGIPMGKRFTGMSTINEKYVSFDGPMFINCNIGDIFPEPTSVEIQDGYIIERHYKSLDYLRDMHKNYPETYGDGVLKLTDEDGTNRKTSSDEVQGGLSRLNDTRITRPDGSARIELLTRWGMDVDPEDGVLKQRLVTIANGKYLIRNTNNPYWHGKIPFVKANYIPVTNEFHGIGIPELSEDLQTTINECVNQRNDNISLSMNRIMIYKKDYVDVNTLKSEPGIRIGIDGERINDVIQFLDIPNNTRDTFSHTAELERWLQEVSAVTKLTMGVTGADSNDTATGMSILQKASGNRFMAIARQIEQVAFKELIKQFYQLDYQYISKDKLIRIIGDTANEYLTITPEDVRRNYDFVPAGIFSLENKQQQALKLIQFKQVTQGDPTIKQTELNRKIYSALEVGDNPDEIMYPDAQMQEIMNMAKMMAMKLVAQQTGQEEPKKPGGSNSGQFTKGSVVGSSQVPPPTPPSTMGV